MDFDDPNDSRLRRFVIFSVYSSSCLLSALYRSIDETLKDCTASVTVSATHIYQDI